MARKWVVESDRGGGQATPTPQPNTPLLAAVARERRRAAMAGTSPTKKKVGGRSLCLGAGNVLLQAGLPQRTCFVPTFSQLAV